MSAASTNSSASLDLRSLRPLREEITSSFRSRESTACEWPDNILRRRSKLISTRSYSASAFSTLAPLVSYSRWMSLRSFVRSLVSFSFCWRRISSTDSLIVFYDLIFLISCNILITTFLSVFSALFDLAILSVTSALETTSYLICSSIISSINTPYLFNSDFFFSIYSFIRYLFYPISFFLVSASILRVTAFGRTII